MFGVFCERFDMTVGEVAEKRRPEIHGLVQELSRIGRMTIGVEIPTDHLVGRLVAYSEPIPAFRARVGAFEWRHGWFVERARALGAATPVHEDLLKSIGKL